MTRLDEIVGRCEELYEDVELECVHRWKAEGRARKAVGFLPTYVPREILHAAGVLPVGILGGGDQIEIVRGDAYFQSYICHLPRSVVELGLSGKLDVLDGMIFPAICDVIRNLSGIWQLQFPAKYVRYLDVPQNFDLEVGGVFYEGCLRELFADMAELAGRKPRECDLGESIRIYNTNRALVHELYDLRADEPWLVPTSEAYLVLRAGLLLPVEQHTELLRDYLDAARQSDRHMVDNARVLLNGAFCEQPPLTLIRTLERAGCEVVDDDFLPVMRWLGSDVDDDGDPIASLSRAFLEYGGEASSRYVVDGGHKGKRLLDSVHQRRAEGVIFAAPSFCDPALLDRPMLMEALSKAGVGYTAFKYSENTGQMQPIREQAGTFADTIKLWEEG